MTRLPIPLPLPTPLISPQSSNLARYHFSIVKLRPPPPTSAPPRHQWERARTRGRTEEEDKEGAAEGKVSISEETKQGDSTPVTPGEWVFDP